VQVPIPESQLDTWSNPGALTSSATAYNSIKTALASTKSKVSALDYDAFLQGSYRNSTNIYGDSDVDIVVQLNSVFGKDVTRLDAEQRTAQQQAYTTATYNWADFRRDVLQTLEDYYGNPNVHPLKKCIQVLTGPGRITADVIPALEFRNYDYFYSALVESHTTGVKFYDSAGIEIVNYPKLHIANGEAKNAADRTNGWYKGTVRMFKNARNRLITDGKLADGVAPSYCVECLIYNAPDACFGGSYGDTYCAVVNHLWHTPLAGLYSQNGIIPLLGTSSVQWNADAATKFLSELRDMWVSWK
jgi:Nucleotidyltransferase domain